MFVDLSVLFFELSFLEVGEPILKVYSYEINPFLFFDWMLWDELATSWFLKVRVLLRGLSHFNDSILCPLFVKT